MYNIISNLLGGDFIIKDGFTYTTRLIKILNETSPIKITFDLATVFPIRVYIRRLKSDNSEVDLSIPMDIYDITNINDVIDIILEKNVTILIIFEYKIKDKMNDKMEFEIHFEESNYSTTPLMYMYETKTGIPYQVYKLGGYSEYEFNYKTGLYTTSNSYLGKSIASKPLVGHIHDNERGFIDRVYTLSKYNKIHGKKLYRDKFLDEKEKKEIEFVYLNNGEYHQTIVDQSNNVIRGILFQAEDKIISERIPRQKASMSISGTVWLDEFPLNGILNTKELKLKDVKVTLFNKNDKIINTVITNENGEYSIDIYEEDMYYLKFDYSFIETSYNINGFTIPDFDKKNKNSSNVDNLGRSKDLYLNDGNRIIINAGLKKIANTKIYGYVWLENYLPNGILENNELRLSNIKVTLHSITNKEIVSTMTDNEGYFSIEKFDEGEYYLKFDYTNSNISNEINGFTQKNQDTDENSSSVNPLFGKTDNFYIYHQESIQKNAGLIKKYKSVIKGKVWIDEDEDGLLQQDEPFQKNVNIVLYDKKTNTQLQSIFSDENGEFFFNVEIGKYYLKFNYIPVLDRIIKGFTLKLTPETEFSSCVNEEGISDIIEIDTLEISIIKNCGLIAETFENNEEI